MNANIPTNFHPDDCPSSIFTMFFRVNNGILVSTLTIFA